jgi:iron complex outermembrane receptor protein
MASVGYIDHEYTELDPRAVVSGITAQSKLPGTPEWSGSLGLQYTWALGGGDLALRGDYSYRSMVYFNAVNGPLEGGDEVSLVNARASYTFASDALTLSAYVLNATDEEYVSNGQDVTAALGVAFNAVGPPREWGMELTYRFGQ